MAIDYSGLPEHMREVVQDYVQNGSQPGGFLTAVICNDLREACNLADSTNKHRLFDIVAWFYNEAPAPCWGSREKMNKWIENAEYN